MREPRLDTIEATAVWRKSMYRVEIERMEEEEWDDEKDVVTTKLWAVARVVVVDALDEGEEEVPTEVELSSWDEKPGGVERMVVAAIEKAAS